LAAYLATTGKSNIVLLVFVCFKIRAANLDSASLLLVMAEYKYLLRTLLCLNIPIISFLSALNTQIAIAQGELVSKEDKLETSKENLDKARINNGVEIINNESYVENLLQAHNSVTIAENDLKKHQAKIEFLQVTLKGLSEEVEA